MLKRREHGRCNSSCIFAKLTGCAVSRRQRWVGGMIRQENAPQPATIFADDPRSLLAIGGAPSAHEATRLGPETASGSGDSCLASDRSIRCRVPLSRSAINVTRRTGSGRGAIPRTPASAASRVCGEPKSGRVNAHRHLSRRLSNRGIGSRSARNARIGSNGRRLS